MAEKKEEITSVEKELVKLNRNISAQNRYYRNSSVILRSMFTGVFTAIGATVGFTLVIIISASFVRTISAVPIIQDILKETRLDKIIEYQLSLIDQQGQTPTPTPSSTPTPTDFHLEN